MPYRMFPLLIVLAFGCSSALAQIRIGLMVSATGPTAAIGIPQKNTGALLATRVGDTTIEYVQLEDGGDTTRAVQNAKKLIGEDHIDALIGPSTTPNALAILDIIAENKVPLLATVGTSSVVEPIDAKRRWVFKTTQNDDLIAAALIAHMRKNGVRTVGPIKQVASGYMSAYEKRFGTRPATFGANTFDAGLLLQRALPMALRAAKPGTEAFRVALRDALEQQQGVVGCQGVFNMNASNHNGMDERARVLVVVRDGRFRLLAQ